MLFPLFLVDLLLFALFAIEGDIVTLALLDIFPDFVLVGDLDAVIMGRLVGELGVKLGDTVVGVFCLASVHANWVGDELFASH